MAGLAVVALIFWVFSEALLPGPLSEIPGVAIANPFGIEAARELLVLVGIIGEVLNAIGVRASDRVGVAMLTPHALAWA